MSKIKKVLKKIKNEARIFLERNGLTVQRNNEDISKNRLKKWLPANPVVIDCGSNDGKDSVDLARIIPGATVHAFEPVPKVFEMLKKATGKYKNIQCYQLALSDKTGKAEMYVSSNAVDDRSSSSSLLAPKTHLDDYPEVRFDERVEVDTVTLDDWASAQGIDHIDLLWLDMQGFEMQMLSASKIILPAVKVIYTEVSMKETYDGVTTYHDYKAFLEGLGFHEIIKGFKQGHSMGNALFVRQ